MLVIRNPAIVPVTDSCKTVLLGHIKNHNNKAYEYRGTKIHITFINNYFCCCNDSDINNWIIIKK
jgi:hypothetical protein